MSNATPHYTYHQLPSGIYEINIHQTTRQAVDEFFHYLKQVYAEGVAQNRLPVRTIVTAPSRGPLPVIPLTAGLRSWAQLYGQTPSRSIILYEGSFGTLVDVMTRNFGNRIALTRVFDPQRREEGIEWLLSDL